MIFCCLIYFIIFLLFWNMFLIFKFSFCETILFFTFRKVHISILTLMVLILSIRMVFIFFLEKWCESFIDFFYIFLALTLLVWLLFSKTCIFCFKWNFSIFRLFFSWRFLRWFCRSFKPWSISLRFIIFWLLKIIRHFRLFSISCEFIFWIKFIFRLLLLLEFLIFFSFRFWLLKCLFLIWIKFIISIREIGLCSIPVVILLIVRLFRIKIIFFNIFICIVILLFAFLECFINKYKSIIRITKFVFVRM